MKTGEGISWGDALNYSKVVNEFLPIRNFGLEYHVVCLSKLCWLFTILMLVSYASLSDFLTLISTHLTHLTLQLDGNLVVCLRSGSLFLSKLCEE